MKTCIFIGPSNHGAETIPGVTVFPPAALGSVFKAWEAGYQRIAIVDGFFGNVPSVWHKEILYVLAHGGDVWGAASTGALRAAELKDYGMKGIGIIFRLYLYGILTDDDEVCLLHAPRELSYMNITYPMINIRYTLRRMRRRGCIDLQEEALLASELKKVYFASRDRAAITATFKRQYFAQSGAIDEGFENSYVDIKQRDVALLLRKLGDSPSERQKSRPEWTFPTTAHWKMQFERRVDDVPQLLEGQQNE